MKLSDKERETLESIRNGQRENIPYEVALTLREGGLIKGVPLTQGIILDVTITQMGIDALDNKDAEEIQELTKENLTLQNRNLKCEWWTKPINIVSALLGIVVAGITIYLFVFNK